MRQHSLSVRKNKGVSLIAIAFIVVSLLYSLFGNAPFAHAATYTFTQNSWSGGATANTAVHPTNETGWNQYSSLSSLVASSTMQLATTSASLSARTDVTQNFSYSATNPVMAIATSTGVIYVAYVSREYSYTNYNIALRSSSNWSNRVDVTTNTTGAISLQTPTIAIGPDGTVHIAYYSYEYNSSFNNIAYRNSTNWATRTDVTTSTSNISLSSPSLAVDSTGKVHIAYYSKESSSLRYNIAYRNSTNWATRTDVTTNTTLNSYNPSLVVDSTGKVHIAYYSTEYSSGVNNIAYRNSTNWATRTDVTASTTASSYNPSLAVDSTGKVHIAYASYEYSPSNYNIAYRNSTNWATRTDVTTSSIGTLNTPSLAVDSTGTVHIAYYSQEFQAGSYNIAYRNSTNWATRTDVTTSASAGPVNPSLAVDSTGKIHIAYYSYEYSSSFNNIAYRNSTNWATRTDVTTQYTQDNINPATAVATSTGVTYVAYVSREYVNGYYNVALRSSSNWSNRIDVTTDTAGKIVSQTPTIALGPDGTVHVAYYSTEYNGSNNIAYRNSTNWATRTDVTTSATASSYNPSLAVDSTGKVHLAYYSTEYSNKYNIAYRNSTNWATRTDVTTSASANSYNPFLAVDSTGKIHIAYYSYEYSSSFNNIAYRNSTNWATRTDVTTSASANSYNPSLAVDSTGNVHIAYYSTEYNGSYNIAYRNSTNWATRTDVTTSTTYAYNPSLAVDSTGTVHIAYYSREYNNPSYNIAYRNSTNWATRTDVNTNGFSYNPSLAVDSTGKLHIAYYSKEVASSNYNIAYKEYTAGGYASSGNLVASGYDSGSAANIIGSLAWAEDSSLPSGATVTVSLRTAATSGGLSSAAWSDFTNATVGCTKASGTVTCASSAIPAAMKDGLNDEWYQYKVTLGGSGNTPTVSSVTVQYVVNASPGFDPALGVNGSTALQDATSTDANFGKANITYGVKDIDTTSDSVTPGFITPSFEYNTGSGWNAIGSQYLAAGDTSNKAVNQNTYTQYTATWNATSQISGVYAPTTQIRITANDNEVANNTTTTVTAAFTLDTKNPAVSAFTINGASSTITLTASDDTALRYQISNNSSFTGTSFTSAGGTSFSTTTAWTLPGGSSYQTVYAQFKDAYGNTTTTSATTPNAPQSMDIKDVSNVAANLYQNFISWNVYTSTSTATFVSYKIYKSSDGGTNYSLASTIADINTNYYRDTSLSSSTTYYYKALTTDTDGDISPFSSIVSHLPNGQGGTDLTPPTISAVTVSTTQATWATITWTTDELSDSEVDYSVSPSTAFGTVASSTAYATSHSVTLTGLTPNTTYLFQVKSRDITGNLRTDASGGGGYTLTTVGGPTISAVTTQSVNDSSASIIWNTDKNSNSYVDYSTNLTGLRNNSGVTETGTATLAGGTNPYQHTVTLSGLSSRTTYYYYVKSTDANSNTATDTNGGNYYTFTTTYDTKAPTITNVSAPIVTKTAAIITWQTDKLATSQVAWGASGSYTNSNDIDNTLTIYHNMALTNLTKNAKYYFVVKSRSAAGTEAVSSENNFTTSDTDIVISSTAGGAAPAPQKDTTPPVISNVTSTNITAFGATIIFDTDKLTLGIVSYGKDAGYGLSAGAKDPGAYTASHSLALNGLQFGTAYHFKVKAIDMNGNSATSNDLSFTTRYAAESLSNLEKLQNAEQFQSQLENLIESTLPSLVPPFVGKVTVTDVSETSATVHWTTNVPAVGSIAYASKTSYDEKKDNPYATEINEGDKKVSDHGVTLNNLSPSTLYHFQVKSFNLPGVIGKSKDDIFTTLASKIKPEITRIGNDFISVAWVTASDASSFLEAKDSRTGKIIRTGDQDKKKTHALDLQNLTPNTSYEIRAFGYDNDNIIVEADPLTVKTSQDVAPPVIFDFKIDNALIPGRTDRLQTIISWRTDELANSIVYYDEGVGTVNAQPKNKAGDEKTFSMDHTVIITSFRPSTVYRLQIASEDQAGNLATGPLRTIITPKQAESITDIIIKNFEDTFKFLQKIQ